MKKFWAALPLLAFLPAATCDEIPPGAQCTLQGTYRIFTFPRSPDCDDLALEPQIVDEPVTIACDTQDDAGNVCYPAPSGESTPYCYGVLEVGGCTYDTLTVLE